MINVKNDYLLSEWDQNQFGFVIMLLNSKLFQDHSVSLKIEHGK